MGLFDNIHAKLDEALRAAYEEDRNELNDGLLNDKIQKSATYKRISLTDPNLSAYNGGGYGLYKPRFSHISFRTLKEMSLRDPIVSAVIQTRVNQISAFARPQSNRHDIGFKIVPIDPSLEINKGSAEEKEIQWLTDYILNAGVVNEHRADNTKIDFDTWLKVVVRDRLTFGAIAIETVRDKEGRIFAFLPVPAESVYHANDDVSDDVLDHMMQANIQIADIKTKSGEAFSPAMIRNGSYEFLQVIEGKVERAFTRKELIYKLGNPQNFIDSNGYAIGELELATNTITTHLQAENYNKLFFTHGFAARGLLHIKGDIPPAKLQAFRAQWYAQISGNMNSWRTPVLAGADEVTWVPLSANNKDMEYTAYVDHIIRILCALFQISPYEIGFDYLSRGSGQSSLSTSDNKWKLEEAQDRGLRPLLVWIESFINADILPGIGGDLWKKYKFCFVGLDAESKTQELERQRNEITLHTAIDDIRKEIGKDPVLAGKVILNGDYINFLFRTHTLGEIREMLLGYTGDKAKQEFDYIIDSPTYVQLKHGLGAPPPPGGEQGQPGEPSPSSGIVENAVVEYLQEHPELIEKSLVKAVEPSELDETHEKIRRGFIDVYSETRKKMTDEILKDLEKDLENEETESEEDITDSRDDS